MKPHPRIRKFVKWGGAAVCMLFAGLWVWSTREPVFPELVPGHTMELTNAGVHILPPAPATPLDPRPGGYSSALEMRDWNRPWSPVWGVTCHHDARGWLVFFPFWIPGLVCAVASAWAWRLDILARRRATLGLCSRCHYSRTGLAPSARCPECGAAAPVS